MTEEIMKQLGMLNTKGFELIVRHEMIGADNVISFTSRRVHILNKHCVNNYISSGSWMCDLAIHYPKTLFVGVDISPMFPRENPSNAAFLECNILEKLPFPDNTFDFVHQRMLSGGITQKLWENHIIMELVRITKPTGYVEFVEADSTFYSSGKVTRRISNACKYNSCAIVIFKF